MKRVNRKKVKALLEKMNDAWKNGAKDVVFKGHTQIEMENVITSVAAKEQQRDDLRAQADLLDDEIGTDLVAADKMRVEVAEGVRGDENYGDDSPLYGAMGFIRKSERKSGLTRGNKTDDNPPNG